MQYHHLLSISVFLLAIAGASHLFGKHAQRVRATALRLNSPISVTLSVWQSRMLSVCYASLSMAVLCLIVFATLQTNEKFASLGNDVILGGIAFASFVTGVVFVIVGTNHSSSYKALLGQNDPVTKAMRERYATRAQRSEVASGACYLLFALFWFAASRH